LDIREGFELIQTAYTKYLEDKLWQRWLVELPYMDKDHFITFDNYKKKALGDKSKGEYIDTSKLDKEKNIAEAEEIRKLDRENQKRGGKK
jgi:hypothetical protein